MYIWIRFGIKSVRDKYSVVTYQSKFFVKCIYIIVYVNENRFSLFLLLYCTRYYFNSFIFYLYIPYKGLYILCKIGSVH